MNRRQHKKVMCSLVSKVLAKMTRPEFYAKATRSERKVFKNEYAKVRYLVYISYQGLMDRRGRPMS